MSRPRAGRAAIAFVLVTCVLTPVAYMAMFSGFNAYDDEGSFLITLRDYLSGQSLYTQIFSIYGPLYYEAMAGLFKLLGLEPGHDSGRFVTLVIWLIGNLAGGLAAYRLTRNGARSRTGRLSSSSTTASLKAACTGRASAQ